MPVPLRCPRAFAALLLALLAFVSFDVAAATAKKVLVLHSFGHYAPYDAVAAAFRADLARRSPDPINFIEVNLDFRRAAVDREERVLIDYLQARFDDGAPDLVVTLGPGAARFYHKHRDVLFGAVPVMFTALEDRFARQLPRRSMDSVISNKVDLPALFGHVLTVLPQTETIAIVVGTSDLERFWAGELKRELAPLASRVRFEWMNDLSLRQMQERVAQLPPRSAIFYGLMIVDAAGVPHERQDALAALYATANAPIFGIYEEEIGKGVVGGPYGSQKVTGAHMASAALVALNPASPPGSGTYFVQAFETPMYDYRELQRWNIDHANLPPGSSVHFKPPTLWQQYSAWIVATIAVLVLQAGLIAGLLIQRMRRREAEREARHFGGRVLTAQEEERRRLAREMHDDVTQRLAMLAIDTAKVQHEAGASAIGRAIDAIRQRLVKLSEDVHALSYRLHPSLIEDLGFVAALRVECSRVARQAGLSVDFDDAGVPQDLPPNVAICLYRIVQEALRNATRHAQATKVTVAVQAQASGLTLIVRDDGAGFDPGAGRARRSLGLVSMRERVRLIGGKLDVESAPGRGTSVLAWVPKEALA
ncbi:MAG: sensor histidine kinase [Burkholderiales bacterium]